MTVIFDVFTEPREGNTLRGVVTYRDSANYGFGQGPVFGLQLVMDAWERGGDFGAGPVSAETAAEFKDLFRLSFNSDYQGNDPAEIKRRAAEDNAELRRRTGEIIVSWKVEEYDDEDGSGGSAHFTLDVSDPRYLEHFEKTAYFETAFSGLLRYDY